MSKMKDKLVTIGAVLGIIASTYNPIKAQPPLFAGYEGSKYALESRLNQDIQITEIGKTFRAEIPVWAYFGASTDKPKKPFYGMGPRVAIGRIHTLPTFEWYARDFTGISVYSTIDLPQGFYLDLVPNLDNNFDYAGTEFTFHRDIKGLSFGVSFGSRDLENVDLQLGKYRKRSNITGNFNPKTRKGKLSYQINFN